MSTVCAECRADWVNERFVCGACQAKATAAAVAKARDEGRAEGRLVERAQALVHVRDMSGHDWKDAPAWVVIDQIVANLESEEHVL